VKQLSSVFLAVLALVPPASGAVQAVTINDIADDFTVNWFLAQGGSDNDGSTAPFDVSTTAAFDVTVFNATRLTLGVTITNTTNTSNQSSIHSFGIGVNPNATSVSLSNPGNVVFTNAEVQSGQQNYPGGFKQIDVCVYSPNNCSGGAFNGGLLSGNMDAFTLTIFGNFSGGSVTLAPFPIKFQTSGPSLEFAGTTGATAAVPEPGTLILLGSGLTGLGLKRWRQRSKGTKA
jgi:hypothetical protein